MDRTRIFSDHLVEGELGEAEFMIASLHEGMDDFDHNVDSNLALMIFAEKGDDDIVQQLMELGVEEPYLYPAIKQAARGGNKSTIRLLLQYVNDYDKVYDGDIVKLELLKSLSETGDPRLRRYLKKGYVDGSLDVLQPGDRRDYLAKLLTDMAWGLRPVRSSVPPHVVAQIAKHAYGLDGMTLYETVSIIEEAMKKRK